MCWRWCWRCKTEHSDSAENEGPRRSSSHSRLSATAGLPSHMPSLQGRSTSSHLKIRVPAGTNPGTAPRPASLTDSARIYLSSDSDPAPKSPRSDDLRTYLGPADTQTPSSHGLSPRRKLTSHDRTSMPGGSNQGWMSRESNTTHLDSSRNEAPHGYTTAVKDSDQNRGSQKFGPTDSYPTEGHIPQGSGATSRDPGQGEISHGEDLTSSGKHQISPDLIPDSALGLSSGKPDLGYPGSSTSLILSDHPARVSLSHVPDAINSSDPTPASPYFIPGLVPQSPTHSLPPSGDSTPASPEFARIPETPRFTSTFTGFSHSPKIQGSTRDRLSSVGEIYPTGSTPKTPDFTISPETLHSGSRFPGASYSPKTPDPTQNQVSQGPASHKDYHINSTPKAEGSTRDSGSKNPVPIPAPAESSAPASPGPAPSIVSKGSRQKLKRRPLDLVPHGSLQALRKFSFSPVSGTPGIEKQYGLSILFDGANPDVDLVAVHGLGGHREETWTAHNGAFWLRDYLPGVVPNARILTYGYDGTSSSSQLLHDHAVDLITNLTQLRETTDTTKRPIIFIAYSIGGIILKDALIHSNSANKRHLEHHHAIKTSTCGVLFFGTPHQGADGLKWRKLFRNTASLFTGPDHPILQGLKSGSRDLQKQLGQYTHISKEFNTKFFYETQKSSGNIGKKYENALCYLKGEPNLSKVVPKASAVVPGFTNTEEIAIYSDHMNLVKYESSDDQNFKTVSAHISLMAKKAPKKASKNWKRWERMKAAENDGVQVTFEIPFDLEYRRNPHFTGRGDILTKLRHEIEGRRSVPVVLHGIGGIGKTQIAIEYIYRHLKKFTSIFWINASTKESTQDGFREIAQRLVNEHARVSHDPKPDYLQIAKHLHMAGAIDVEGYISPKEVYKTSVVQGIKQWLAEEGNCKWLLVFDHVDDLESFRIQDFFPLTAQGSIIMTSRRPACGDLGTALLIPGMSQPEAADLLLRSAGREVHLNRPPDFMEAEVTKRLGGLPIAIVQAGAYVGTRNIPFQKYAATFDKRLERLLHEKPESPTWEYGDQTVFTTWEVSFEAVREKNEKAAELLSLCSFLSNENIDEDMLCRGKELDEDDPTLGDCMKVLFSYSLIQRTESEESFYINSVVHTWARMRLESSDRLRRAAEAAILVGRVISYAYTQTNPDRHFGRIIGHADTVSSNIERYLEPGVAKKGLVMSLGLLVKISNDWGRWGHAEKLQLLVVEGTERLQGRMHKDCLTSKANLAVIYRNQGRWENMEQLQHQVMEDSQELLGMADPFTIKTMETLASTYKRRERWEDAEKLQIQVVDFRQRSIRGRDDPKTLKAMAALAEIYSSENRFEEAEKIEKEVWGVRLRTLGAKHPDTILAKEIWDRTFHRLARNSEISEL